MKKYQKILSICALIFLLTTVPVFSQTIANLQAGADSFSTAIAKAMPFNSMIGLNWSDAYIGQLLDIPPNFGVGLSFGVTTMKMGPIEDLLSQFDANMPVSISTMPLPGYTLEGRIGGFILPFDIGLKFGYFPEDLFGNLNIKYNLFGFDFRYAILKGDILPIKLSVGLGYNRLDGGISASASGTKNFKFSENNVDYTLNITDPRLGLLWTSNVFELKTQVSFPLIIITPYAGAGISYSWSKAGYEVSAPTTISSTTGTEADAIEILRKNGIKYGNNGFSSIQSVNDWNTRLFGGLSFNLTVIKLDLTAMYNVRDNGFGGTFGVRFQL